MTQNNNNLVNRSNDPEQIDLLDLVLQLWRGKGMIATFVVVCIVLAVGYLSVAKEKWTSTAIIAQPDVAQIATYSNALNILYWPARTVLGCGSKPAQGWREVLLRMFPDILVSSGQAVLPSWFLNHPDGQNVAD